MAEPTANAIVEEVARTSWGRLVAWLAARSHDVAAAEDALSDAFRAALETWPSAGIPRNPDVWLLAAARRRLIDEHRRRQVRDQSQETLARAVDEAEQAIQEERFPDERLRLLFVAAHPAIDPAIRTPLMLQTVLGLDAARIASAFLVSPTAMGQRLVRAKAKIRETRISFDLPGTAALAERLDAVLEAIYAAYGTGWEDVGGLDPRSAGLVEEAIWLARVVVGLLPESGEAKGLLALMLTCESRRAARRTAAGEFVPLAEQDVGLWSVPMIREAETLLGQAAAQGPHGRFQWEAAIQAIHAQRLFTGRTEWRAIALLYEQLLLTHPTAGIAVGRAVALGHALGAEAALGALDEIPDDQRSGYQPWWAVRAHWLSELGRTEEARDAYQRAIGLTEDPAVRRWLQGRMG